MNSLFATRRQYFKHKRISMDLKDHTPTTEVLRLTVDRLVDAYNKYGKAQDPNWQPATAEEWIRTSRQFFVYDQLSKINIVPGAVDLSSAYGEPVCSGSPLLGTACGKCERCAVASRKHGRRRKHKST